MSKVDEIMAKPTNEASKPEQQNSKLIAYCESCSAKNPASFRGAKDALTGEDYEDLCCDSCHSILATLSGRLPAGEAEPVYQVKQSVGASIWADVSKDEFFGAIRHDLKRRILYTTPQQSQPLTDEQIEKGRKSVFSTDNPFCPCDRKTMLKAVRWAEAAHNIKGATE